MEIKKREGNPKRTDETEEIKGGKEKKAVGKEKKNEREREKKGKVRNKE